MTKKSKTSEEISSLLSEFYNKIEKIDSSNCTEILSCKLAYINKLIEIYRVSVQKSISDRLEEMENDKNEHHLIYKVLGIKKKECKLIDAYQNIGRFVFKYAGALIEDIAVIALGGRELKFKNNVSSTPKEFQIDCYTSSDNKAHEIKWKDATTDGDHRKKEEYKINGILNEGYIPVRIMFFMPERKQAIAAQEKIIALYRKNGQAYVGQEAFDYIYNYSGIDILKIFNNFIDENNYKKYSYLDRIK